VVTDARAAEDAARFVRLEIRDTRMLTDDALAVRFVIPAEYAAAFTFDQGQYLTLRVVADGETLTRSYSICSPAGEPSPLIAIKRIDGGRFSTFAHREFEPGVRVDVAPPAGSFTMPIEPDSARSYLCIAAGCGITPILSIVATVLAREPRSRVTLLYGNRSTATMMFRDELCFLKNAYLDRLQWINVMSRERQEAEVLNGRIDNRKGAALNGRLIHIRAFDHFFLCGPEAMISEVSRGLRGEGVDPQRIHYELFRASAQDARAVIEKHRARAERFAGASSEVRVRSGGREIAFELAADGENLLDATLDAGLEVPFSCRGGVCATCKAKLVEGEVEMDIDHALDPAERAAGYILTCQAHPLTPRIVVDYDV
jgi:ring-1,2-phenylacetyl-CoA epoxidase subunit PaaE